MQDFASLLGKSVRRFLLPGLSAFIFILWSPLKIFNPKLIKDLGLFDPIFLLISVLLMGYLLDSLGTYRYTLSYKLYEKYFDELLYILRDLKPGERAKDPDIYISKIWLLERELYERIFTERAEWVMILEFSFCMLLGGIILIILFVINVPSILHNETTRWIAFPIGGTLIYLSSVASKKGIQRMRAHDSKVITAFKYVDDKK